MTNWNQHTETITELHRATSDAIVNARNYRNDDLSSAGLHKARGEMLTAAQNTAIEALAKARTSLTSALATATKSAASTLRADGSTRDEWERVRILLDAGKSLADIVDEATTRDRIIAIREWAPTWLEAVNQNSEPRRSPQQYEDAVNGSTLKRLLEIDPTSTAADLYAGHEAHARLAPVLDDIARLTVGGAPSGSASMRAGYAATMNPDGIPTIAALTVN